VARIVPPPQPEMHTIAVIVEGGHALYVEAAAHESLQAVKLAALKEEGYGTAEPDPQGRGDPWFLTDMRGYRIEFPGSTVQTLIDTYGLRILLQRHAGVGG
jgi:hypothetical protein